MNLIPLVSRYPADFSNGLPLLSRILALQNDLFNQNNDF